MRKVWKVEVRGRGFLEYEFKSKQECEQYVKGILSWSGVQYRISQVIVEG